MRLFRTPAVLAGLLLFAALGLTAQPAPDDPAFLPWLSGEIQRQSDIWKRFEGITYRATQGNRLEGDWLLQTPEVWGRSAASVPTPWCDGAGCDPDFRLRLCSTGADCLGGTECAHLRAFENGLGGAETKMCIGPSDRRLDAIHGAVAEARQFVDLTTLWPLPDQRFQATLRNALTALAVQQRPVTVRVLAGLPMPEVAAADAQNAKLAADQALAASGQARTWLEGLVRDARRVPGSRLRVFTGAMRSCSGISSLCRGDRLVEMLSWNHAKIAAVDGQALITGGHNLWTGDYLVAAPIHDVTLALRGPAARDAHRFVDEMWKFTCTWAWSWTAPGNFSFEYRPGRPNEIERGCLAKSDLPAPPPTAEGVPVLTLGRLGRGMFEEKEAANQSDWGRALLMRASRRTIRLSQQDLGLQIAGLRYWPLQRYPHDTLKLIAEALLAQKDVYIVLSDPGATSGTGTPYSYGVSLRDVAAEIRKTFLVDWKGSAAEADALLCERLHLAPIRFSRDTAWPGGQKIGNHSKLLIIDDAAFYVGSHNAYASNLQEYGVVVQGTQPTGELLARYWDELWKFSGPAAISGREAASCVFRR